MSKFLFVIVLMSVVAGCTGFQFNNKSDASKTIDAITYVKDPRTGLCFAVINSLTQGQLNVTSIACVPCDSLANLK